MSSITFLISSLSNLLNIFNNCFQGASNMEVLAFFWDFTIQTREWPVHGCVGCFVPRYLVHFHGALKCFQFGVQFEFFIKPPIFLLNLLKTSISTSSTSISFMFSIFWLRVVKRSSKLHISLPSATTRSAVLFKDPPIPSGAPLPWPA